MRSGSGRSRQISDSRMQCQQDNVKRLRRKRHHRRRDVGGAREPRPAVHCLGEKFRNSPRGIVAIFDEENAKRLIPEHAEPPRRAARSDVQRRTERRHNTKIAPPWAKGKTPDACVTVSAGLALPTLKITLGIVPSPMYSWEREKQTFSLRAAFGHVHIV